ncbi:MAG: flagellar hook-associated protein FlgL [Chloroflexi bacterium]|nr:flagellar hook-associated protein FlgL [Chloroflexota bacterium]
MRISTPVIFDNAIRHMTANQTLLAALQEKASSGKQFTNISDNPTAASTALSLRSTLQIGQDYLSTAQNTDDWMSATDQAFQQMSDLAKRAISLVVEGLSDTLGDSERKNALGSEMGALINQAVDLGNASHQGNYLFSGFQIKTRPFSYDGSDSVDYQGDNGTMLRDLGPGQTVAANTDGEQAFMPFFEALISARNALNDFNRNDLQDSLDALNGTLDTVSQYRADNGARQREVKAVIDQSENTQLQLKSLLSKKEDTNMAEAISLLQAQETTYQAVLEVSQRSISMLNLFDVLR